MGRLLPPLSGPHKIIRVGLTYASHAAEADVDVPERPLLFGKVWHTVIGPGAEIRMPYEDCHLDYEASWRLSSAIRLGGCPPTGARVRGGYTCFNDVSDRAAQLGDGPVVPGQELSRLRSARAAHRDDGTSWRTPGPADQLPCEREVKRLARTWQMLVGISELVSYGFYQFDLHLGEVIATGTPSGVALGSKSWLRPGDSVEVEIEGVGTLHNTVAGMRCPGHTGRSVGLEVPLRLDVWPGRGCDAACLVAGEGAQRAGEDVRLAVQRRPKHPGAP
jgi:2,4-didehydro-3-deoxy-L-rhamnonate hydrolase